MTLFTKRDGPLKTWSDLTTLKPLKVCSLERGTAAFVAEQMMASKGGIPMEVATHDVDPGDRRGCDERAMCRRHRQHELS